MTTLADRTRSALLIVDVQAGVVADAWQSATIVARIADLAAIARAAGVPVIWVQHSSADLVAGSDGWQLAAGLVPHPSEAIVAKRYGDSFEDTDLERVLAGLQVGHLIVCGAKTDACIISTLYGGLVRGYDVTLVADAHTTNDKTTAGLPGADQIIASVNFIWGGRRAPGRTARALPAAQLNW